MKTILNPLPKEVAALQSLMAEQLVQNEKLITENQRYKSQVVSLQEQLNLALARRYAASSEKISPDQLHFFSEAEDDDAEVAQSPVEETIAVPAHTAQEVGS